MQSTILRSRALLGPGGVRYRGRLFVPIGYTVVDGQEVCSSDACCGAGVDQARSASVREMPRLECEGLAVAGAEGIGFGT
jgi:hypothetical protein